MKPIAPAPSLADQAYQALVDEICGGSLPSGSHLVQDQLAKRLGVSRQPIQQVMGRLKADGLVEDAPGRGMAVVALDPSLITSRYQIRSAMDGLAAHLSAIRAGSSAKVKDQIAQRGQAIVKAGMNAVKVKSIKKMVAHDVEFHNFLYACSGNPLLAATCEPHWLHLRRVMSEVLQKAALPKDIWQQHADILNAILDGDARGSKSFAVKHVELACEGLTSALTNETSRS
ncbi:MAG: GntR family transcriptional regulator [Hyphomicrobiaceae bacterium]